MSDKNLFRSYFQLITAVDYCLTEKLILPALILIYSAIDSVSWLASDDDDQPVGVRFQYWVNNWMLLKYPLPCTAVELYAARCGILHTLTPNSSLHGKKKIRLLSYAWGEAKQENLNESIKLLEYPGLVAVHVNDLFSSFRNGFADFIGTLEEDPMKKDIFAQKASKHFANTEISLVNEFLSLSKKEHTTDE
jgi:hypothetical protein